MKKLENLCMKILETREKNQPLEELLRYIEVHPEDKKEIWCFEGMQIVFLQEITSAYAFLDKEITLELEKRITSILNILEHLLTEPSVRVEFLDAQFPFFIYPFLNNLTSFQKYENLRLNSLKVIYSLIQNDPTAASYLKNTEIIPLTLKIMEGGFGKAQLIASKIFLGIISHREGLEYTCQTFERFVAINVILNSVTIQCATNNFPLLRVMLQCYIKLTNQENVRISFKTRKPQAFEQPAIIQMIEKDEPANKLYNDFNKLLIKEAANHRFSRN